MGTVTEAMVRKRGGELATIAGRNPDQILDSDLEQARRELTGEERLNPPATAAEQLPEEKRWDPVPESAAGRVPSVPTPDEQTFAEKLVEEGVEDAEQDQMLEAEQEGRRRDAA